MSYFFVYKPKKRKTIQRCLGKMSVGGCCSEQDSKSDLTATFWKAVNAKDSKGIQKTVLHCCFRGDLFWKLIACAADGDDIETLQKTFHPSSNMPSDYAQLGWNIYCLLDLILACDLVVRNVSDLAVQTPILNVLQQLGIKNYDKLKALDIAKYLGDVAAAEYGKRAQKYFEPSAAAPSAVAPSAVAPSAIAPSAIAPSAVAPSAAAPSAMHSVASC